MLFSALVSMGPAFMILVLFTVGACGEARRLTNQIISEEDKAEVRPKQAGKTPLPDPPAIIAIEIIDPNENKTSKNAKRTIESSLGYGYQGYFGGARKPPRFQVYKYSQHDIPPFRGGGGGGHGISTQNFHIQKSVSYDLPTQTVRYTSVRPSLAQYYTPGTTLYSTLEHGGRLAALSATVPRRPQHAALAPVPVIILRVHPDSLRHPGAALYPQLPRSNPYASQLNGVDVQGLLSNYIENMLRKIKIKTDYPAQQPQPHQQQQQQQQYLPPSAEPAPHYLPEGPPTYQTAEYPQQQVEYPQQKVEYQQQQVEYQPQQQVEYQQQQQVEYQQQSPVYQSEPQPAYPEPEYQQQTYVKYAPPAPEQYEHYQPQQQQQQEYQEVQTQAHGQEGQGYSPATLLTHENYPDDTHTRVIFRTREGHVQTTTPRAAHAAPTSPRGSILKISVPDSSYRLSSVEVRTPETQYSYTPGPDEAQLRAEYEAAAAAPHHQQQAEGQREQQPQFFYIAPGGGQDYQAYQQPQQQPTAAPEPQYLPAPSQEPQYLSPPPQHQEPVQYVTPRVVVRPRGQPPAQHKRRSRSKKGGRRLVRPGTAAPTPSAVKHVTELPAE